ncbi:MAG: HAMP domain-containing sensor histidine kinase [Bacteroidota bacterium]
MKNSTIIRVVLLGVVAIVSVIALQTYWVIETWDVKEQEFNEKVNIALRKVADEFGKISTLPRYDIIDRVSHNYYVVNVNQAINKDNLEYFLRKELEEVGLHECFQYGIHNCSSGKMVSGDIVCPAITKILVAEEISSEELPTTDKYIYYFGVRFPNHGGKILSSMFPTLVLSGILALTLLFFSYSIFVILRQKRLSEMQKDFINNMTHEFKTPISTIKISADVFLNDNNITQNERLNRYAQIIKDQNQRLNTQVEKVLQLAKIERDQFRLKLEEIPMHELLENTLKGTKLKIESQNGTLETALSAKKSHVRADRLHLTNVLHNLIDNAIKYCKDKPHVKIKTFNARNRLVLQIEDQGIGIAKIHQEKVLQKFFRVPTGDVHDVKGFGLGLFYVNNICKGHFWKLKIDSEVGEGTRISIAMPLA